VGNNLNSPTEMKPSAILTALVVLFCAAVATSWAMSDAWSDTVSRAALAESRGVVTFSYVAKRLDASGSYEGKAILKQAAR
jgi:hypothetical protein